MINGKKVIVILPAYNAEKTLKKTYDEIPLNIVDEIILTDDFSNDNTLEIAKQLGLKHIIKHDKNLGYGANQKTCYNKALELHADIIVMLHPDYQYDPKLIPLMCELISNNTFEVVLGSRILGGNALNCGMPLYKYVSNRFLTMIQNLLLSQNLSEYHTGYRAFNRSVLERIPFRNNSDDFIFDNQILAQIFEKNCSVGEVSCPAKYESESSSINFVRSSIYGIGVLIVSLKFYLQQFGLKFKLFNGND